MFLPNGLGLGFGPSVGRPVTLYGSKMRIYVCCHKLNSDEDPGHIQSLSLRDESVLHHRIAFTDLF